MIGWNGPTKQLKSTINPKIPHLWICTIFRRHFPLNCLFICRKQRISDDIKKKNTFECDRYKWRIDSMVWQSIVKNSSENMKWLIVLFVCASLKVRALIQKCDVNNIGLYFCTYSIGQLLKKQRHRLLEQQ